MIWFEAVEKGGFNTRSMRPNLAASASRSATRTVGRSMIFIDETWIKTNMAPLRGWAPKGDHLRGSDEILVQ